MKTKEELNILKEEVTTLNKKTWIPEEEMAMKTNANYYRIPEIELEKVIGGAFYPDKSFSSPGEVEFVANVGDTIEVASGWGFGSTVRCRVVGRRISPYSYYVGARESGNLITIYYDQYECVELESHWYFSNGWKSRNQVQIP